MMKHALFLFKCAEVFYDISGLHVQGQTPNIGKDLCEKFGWPERDKNQRGRMLEEPRIFYGVITNGEDPLLLETHIHEVYDLVQRFVVVEGLVTHTMEKNLHPPLDFDSPNFARFGHKLKTISMTKEMAFNMTRQQKCAPECLDKITYPIENGQRRLIGEAFKDELRSGDIVIVADIDEVVTPEALQALLKCEPPSFLEVKTDLKNGKVPCGTNSRTKVLFKSQYMYFHIDCPVAKVWWHPDAVPADCLLHAGWDTQDVRVREGGTMTGPVAAYHLHNVGRTDEELEFKYKTYLEACSQMDAICHHGNVPEMRKRVCDQSTPHLGPGEWSFSYRALNDLVDPKLERGWLLEMDDSVKSLGHSPLRLLNEQPERFENFWYSRQHGSHRAQGS